MVQNKHVVIGGSALVVTALVVVGFVVLHGHHTKANLEAGLDSSNGGGSFQTATTDATTSSGLGVASGGTDLGQISPGQKESSAAPQGNSTQAGSSGSSSSSSEVDPSTFAQYEKYKSSTQALFGDLKAGDGATLDSGKKATVVYKGWLTNGTLFDGSRAGADGKIVPFSFTEGSGQVIPGWEQGLGGMKVNGVRLVIVPPSVGYGAAGQGSIPPNSVLVFEVQLVSVQ